MSSAVTKKPSFQFLMALIEGSIKTAKLRLVQAWVEIHQDDLMTDGELAIAGEQVFKIEPLR